MAQAGLDVARRSLFAALMVAPALAVAPRVAAAPDPGALRWAELIRDFETVERVGPALAACAREAQAEGQTVEEFCDEILDRLEERRRAREADGDRFLAWEREMVAIESTRIADPDESDAAAVRSAELMGYIETTRSTSRTAARVKLRLMLRDAHVFVPEWKGMIEDVALVLGT